MVPIRAQNFTLYSRGWDVIILVGYVIFATILRCYKDTFVSSFFRLAVKTLKLHVWKMLSFGLWSKWLSLSKSLIGTFCL